MLTSADEAVVHGVGLVGDVAPELLVAGLVVGCKMSTPTNDGTTAASKISVCESTTIT